MISIENISRHFSKKHRNVIALDNVSLKIKKGAFISITGPSGSGKSTLLLAIGGMSTPTKGKILWEDESIYDWSHNKRAQWRSTKIGFVFQSFNLIPFLNVFENVSIALSLAGKTNNNKEKIENILKDLKLSDRFDHLPAELSVGQQQRVSIARALIKKPELILADEPTGNLDPQTAYDILDLLKDVNSKGTTVIMVTHNPNLSKSSNHSIQIIDGRIK